MRIVIDLQACQSSGSRTRGIGRYSLALAQAMARQAGEHEIWLLLSGLFPESIMPLREAFAGLVPAERIRVWQAPAPVAACTPANAWRRQAAELLREQALAELRPDFIHISSLFEGNTDDAVTSVAALPEHLPTAVTLYDLIPLVYADHYLADSQVRAWYQRKARALKNADLLLAISSATRTEALAWLHLEPSRVVNISSAVDDRFVPQAPTPDSLAAMRATYGLVRPFIMYTGGIDHRKNIEGLIRAFAALPATLRAQHQLAVVCSAHAVDRTRLQQVAASAGLARDELIMTGFVPDEILPMLYNDCALFVFPSWHEGFGLPALEAMACGAPVIAANTSSLPEVIGRADALFDPRDDAAISAKMADVLMDVSLRESLRAHGLQQAQKFSWDASARVALAAIEAAHVQRLAAKASAAISSLGTRKPKLAFVSPFPPARSGIADYSAELVTELTRYYDIELVVNQNEIHSQLALHFPLRDWHWFDDHAERYDRVLYHFGNSEFHSHMFALLERHPGTVVLHDFYLSGLLAYRESRDLPHGWTNALYASHGYHALLDKKNARDATEVIMRYPCNIDVLQQADGVIVHAEASRRMAQDWYAPGVADAWIQIPLLRKIPPVVDRLAMRKSLGLGEQDFLVCSFGILAPTKLNHQLVQAWLESPLASNPHAHLVFVGANHGGAYGAELLRTIANSTARARIRITGFAEPALFNAYLGAADAAVQLRTLSRGETSAAVLDCMAHGCPTIVNAHGALAELPPESVIMLDNVCSSAELARQLMALYSDPAHRARLGQQARQAVADQHAPAIIAARYAQAIERFALDGAPARRRRTITAIGELEPAINQDPGELADLAVSLAAIVEAPRVRKILVDVSQTPDAISLQRLRELISTPPQQTRIEPVVQRDQLLRYARQFTCDLLALDHFAADDVAQLSSGDIYIGTTAQISWIAQGVQIFATLDDYLARR